MIYWPVILFAIAAVGGLTLGIMKFSGKDLPWSVVIGHGIFAAAGLIVLIIYVLENTNNILMDISLVLFLITAIGGFIVLSFHLRKMKQPDKLILIHGSAAIISFILLLIALMV